MGRAGHRDPGNSMGQADSFLARQSWSELSGRKRGTLYPFSVELVPTPKGMFEAIPALGCPSRNQTHCWCP